MFTHTHVSGFKVADAVVGGTSLSFYMNSAGYDKLTSVTPCAQWLMKMIRDPDPHAKTTRATSIKSSMAVHVETSVLKVAVACA